MFASLTKSLNSVGNNLNKALGNNKPATTVPKPQPTTQNVEIIAKELNEQEFSVFISDLKNSLDPNQELEKSGKKFKFSNEQAKRIVIIVANKVAHILRANILEKEFKIDILYLKIRS